MDTFEINKNRKSKKRNERYKTANWNFKIEKSKTNIKNSMDGLSAEWTGNRNEALKLKTKQ